MTKRIVTVPNVGDSLLLDCGYGCHESWQTCNVIDILTASRLFDDKRDLIAHVREPNGSVFTTTLVSGY